MKKQYKKGFTLIELLVVIAIIGILSTLAVVSLGNARTRARDSKRLADVRTVQSALEIYYTDQQSYPAGPGANGAAGTVEGLCLDNDTAADSMGWGTVANCARQLVTAPTDPRNNPPTGADAGTDNYTYAQTDSGQGYTILFYLEQATGSLTVGATCARQSGMTSGAC